MRTILRTREPGRWLTLVLAGLGLTCCALPPGPCWGLAIGDELVMTIDGAHQQHPERPCVFEALGLSAGTEVRMTVQGHQERTGGHGEVLCSPSVGTFEADNGWVYQTQPITTFIYGVYGSSNIASKGTCRGGLWVDLSVLNASDLNSQLVPVQLALEYGASEAGTDCPLSCKGSLTGTLVRER